jgi:hypothetical protein
MSLRFCFGALVAVGLAIQLGCCCEPPWPCGRTYCGPQCGCLYWHWWFSHKPECCESCNTCGYYFGSSNPYVQSGPPYTPYGKLYSDGSGSNQPGAIGEMYPAPTGPTPAEAPQSGVLDDASPRNDAEELPGPTTSMPRDRYQRTATRYRPVDSMRGSRTLGRPSRARLFSW